MTTEELNEIARRTGRHPNMADAEYFGLDALSSTELRAVDRSPAYAELVRGGIEPTDDMKFGTWVHEVALEQPCTIACGPDGDWRTKENRKILGKLRSQGVEVVKPAVYDNVMRCANSVRTHPRVADLIVHADALEEVAIWERDGHLCKAKKDGRTGSIIWDLKTCQSVDRFSPYNIADRLYHVQAAWYVDGEMRATGEPFSSFQWVTVSKSAPYEVAIYEATEDTMAAGFTLADDLFELWKTCKERGEWPRHFLKVRAGELPRWAK